MASVENDNIEKFIEDNLHYLSESQRKLFSIIKSSQSDIKNYAKGKAIKHGTG